jgi:oxygen-independent coproporphyrinogen-3 oxidase
VRWWNVKHPAAYTDRLSTATSPAHAREVLDAETQRVERVLLELRLREGLDLKVLDDSGRAAVPDVVARGLANVLDDRLVLTQQGRLLADGVVRQLVP